MQDLNIDIAALFESHESERFSLHTRRLNEQMVRVLRTIGYDVGFCKGSGQYLFDRAGSRYLDLLSGFGVFAVGRNHPAIRAALKSVLDADLPNLVQMDVSTLAGILAERLLALVPHLDKAFFANSGAESVEAAIKFARAATGRPGIVFCNHAFHGLTYGALSLNGDDMFRNRFEPFQAAANQCNRPDVSGKNLRAGCSDRATCANDRNLGLAEGNSHLSRCLDSSFDSRGNRVGVARRHGDFELL